MNEEKDLEKKTFLQLQGFLDTPPLWTDPENFGFPQFNLQQEHLPRSMPPLRIPERLVLGKRIECFFEYYVTHFTSRQIIAANEQIIADKQTLGELDFLVKSPSGHIDHVEVVYKFYVYDPSFRNEKERWIGPNRRDTLVKKLTRLQEQQFPLLYRKETEPLLEQLKITSAEIKQQVCFKASLFLPRILIGTELPLINNECVAGFWIKASEFTASEFGSSRFYSPKKQDWPIPPEQGETWFSFSEIKKQLIVLLDNKRSPLVWMKTPKDQYLSFFVLWW